MKENKENEKRAREQMTRSVAHDNIRKEEIHMHREQRRQILRSGDMKRGDETRHEIDEGPDMQKYVYQGHLIGIVCIHAHLFLNKRLSLCVYIFVCIRVPLGLQELMSEAALAVRRLRHFARAALTVHSTKTERNFDSVLG